MKLREILIVLGILIASSLSFLVIELTKKPGSGVIIKINGEEVANYSLSVDGIYELNGGTNILHIKDGEAWLEDADCPDKLCVKQGKISANGETITCLPNRITITVYGADDFVELEG